MKNILKYLITMLMLSTAIPVLSVVACSKNNNDISESSEEKVIVDPIVQAKNLINEEILNKHREKIYTANSLGLSDTQIRSTMTPLVSQAKSGNSAVYLENNEKISEQILQILQNDLIGSINMKLREKMTYFANISNPTSFTKDRARFTVTKVSFDQMIRVLSDLKNRKSNNLNSQSDDSNKYYVYKLQLLIELDLVLKQGQATHNIYLDIYLTQDKTAFENKISELTPLVREHIKANVTFDLEKLEYQALSETNIKKQILNQINSNNEEKLSISNAGLKPKLLINSLNSTTNFIKEFLKISDAVEINTKISDFFTKNNEFQKYNSDFVSAPDNKEIFLGSFDFTFWNSTYFDLPLQRIELKDNKITVSKGAFATQLLNISEVLNYYFSNVFSEKSKFRSNSRNSVYVYLIVPLTVWKKYMSLTNGADDLKVYNVRKKMNKIFQDTIEEHNKKLLQERNFKRSVFKTLTDETKILVNWNFRQIIGAYRGYSGLSSVSVQLEVGFFILNIIKNADFWYGLKI